MEWNKCPKCNIEIEITYENSYYCKKCKTYYNKDFLIGFSEAKKKFNKILKKMHEDFNKTISHYTTLQHAYDEGCDEYYREMDMDNLEEMIGELEGIFMEHLKSE